MVWYMQLSWRGKPTCGLVRPLFVVKTTWFGIPDFCDAEEEWVGYGVKDHEVRNRNDV